jgi:uncharacterized membrane protein YidH (DUF202 family)
MNRMTIKIGVIAVGAVSLITGAFCVWQDVKSSYRSFGDEHVGMSSYHVGSAALGLCVVGVALLITSLFIRGRRRAA